MKKFIVFLALVAIATCQEVDIVDQDPSKVHVVDGYPDVDKVHVVDVFPGEDGMIIDPGFMMPTVDNDGYMPINIEPAFIDPEFDPTLLDRNHYPKVSDNPLARELPEQFN
ncbi:uncharacterized protein LOC123661675 isoform X2 [Melitaea cinxia]|uniref:uncharacterized protein LOC123661675 isoform X2 n=1 Tax=Melitaea cinxia TaxID=113334 RepID=UPI001E274C7C|nr:uncharacterized protein LOC123661675 isoform X2 [Melitaea cinxia]